MCRFLSELPGAWPKGLRSVPIRWAVCGLMLLALALVSGDEPALVREIRVPFEAIPVLFERESDRVLLPRGQFEELQALARRREAMVPPVPALLSAAQYHLAVGQDRAVITGELKVSVLGEGLQSVPLGFSGLGLRNATLDSRPAPLGRRDDGHLALFVEGQSDHTLAIEAVAPLQTTAARQVLDVALPLPPGSRITLAVPGDVELRSGAAVASRTWDEKAGETRFELVPAGEHLALVLTLNSRLKRKDRVVVVRSVLIAEVTQAYERLHATVSLDVLHRAVDEFRFQVPTGFEVTEVQSPLLSRWAVTPVAGGSQVQVFLREETTGTVVLALSALRTRPDLSAWQCPRLAAQDVVGQVAVVGVLLEDRLQLEAVSASGLMDIDSSVILNALPPSARLEDPGRPPLRAALAYYAPAGDYALSGRFAKPPPGLRVTSNLVLTVGKGGLALRGGFALLAENETLFSVEIDAPAGWDVTRVSDAAGTALAFERYGEAGQPGRLLVRFPKGFAPGTQQTVVLEAVHVPPAWLDPWTAQTVTYPAFAVRHASRDIGALAASGVDDVRVRPETLQGLTALNANEKARYGLAGVETTLAYRYDSPPYAATLAVDRIDPRLTAESFSFFRVEQDALVCHAEIAYDVEEASAARLEVFLPASTPTALAIRGVGDTAVKEFSSQEAGEWRRWTVDLAQPAAGTRKLAVDFQMPLDGGESASVPLPIVRAGGVAYQSGFLAVEGHPELEVRVPQPPRKVDIGELVEAEYQPGPRLLGAYSFVGEPPEVRLSVLRAQGCGLPPAIIREAQIISVLAANGTVQSQAAFALHTKAVYLEIGLPQAAQLWSVTLDGEPVRPQQEGPRILVDLPASQVAAVRELVLVYEAMAPPLSALARTRLEAPRLVLHDGDGTAGTEVPATDLHWRVYLPSGVTVLSTSGSVVAGRFARPGLAAVELFRALYRLSGGLHFGHGLLGGCMAALAPAARARVALGRTLSEAKTETAAAPTDEADYAGVAAAKAPAATPPPAAAPSKTERLFRAAGRERRDGVQVAAGEPVQPAPPDQAQPQPATPTPEPTAPGQGAVEGARSLTIDLAAEGTSLLFRSLGDRPTLRLLTASSARLEALNWAAVAGVLLGGVWLTRRSLRSRTAYLAALLGAATALPVLPGVAGLTGLFNAVFYAAAALLPYYLVVGVATRAWREATRVGRARRPASPSVLASLLAAAVLGLSLSAGHVRAAEATPPATWPVIIQGLPVVEPVSVPRDALIVPYAPGQEGQPGEVLLVSRERFAALWEAAYPDPTRRAPPAPWALAGMTLTGTLGQAEFLVLEGQVEVDVFTEDFADVSLPLGNVVLTRAVLDGQPARLRVVQPAPVPDAAAQQAAPVQPAVPDTLISLPVLGRGRHRLEVTARLRLERQGGWRVAAGRLPPVPAASLELTVAEAGTEVRFSGLPDRTVYDASAAGDVIRTALPESGALRLQWRPKISEGQVDQSLTVTANATFDILEDRLQTAWAMELAFRHGDREVFTVDLPPGYQVEKVEGTNVRGWEVRPEGTTQHLDISLLKQARNSESLTLHAWRQGAIGSAGETTVQVPVLQVAGAVRHSGRILVRHSPALTVRAGDQDSLRRVDLRDEPAPAVRESPLGVRPFQAYEFVRVPFVLAFAVGPALPDVTARVQTILRIAERERDLESRVVLQVQQSPLHRVRIEVPADLDVDRVTAPGQFEWGTAKADGQQVITVYLAHGVQGEVPIVLTGRLGPVAVVTDVSLPRLWVLDIGRQEGLLAVQVDPLYDLVPRTPVNLEAVPLGQVWDWLTEAQKPLTRLAFRYTQADHSGAVALQPLSPGVRCHTVTNVRVTDRAIEETALLYFGIYRAGVQELRFRLPASLADARITVPHLRQKTVQPVPDSGTVAVRLELQDIVSDDVRVLIEHDRLLSDAEQTVTLPVVETGRSDRQYLAIENAGRDEVLVDPGDGFDPLTPQQKEWSAVSALFQGGSTQAYLARSGVAAPRLTFRTKARVTVETAGARIGLAETLMIIDDSGAYRASQTYRIDNRTEQFLELHLPPGAQAWTVRVGDELAKPVLPDPADPQRLQVPLVKTAAGDLDYTVVLKYAGTLRVPGPVAASDLPFVLTANINVEQSQVELWLPATRRWFGFGGTLRQVREGGEFEAGYLAYQNKLAKRLMETLQYGNVFEKARAVSNLKQVNVQMLESQQLLSAGEGLLRNEALQVQMEQSQKLVQDADVQLREAESAQGAVVAADNRGRMNQAFGEQATGLARNRVVEAGANWDVEEVRKGTGTAAVDHFRQDWLYSNSLSVEGKPAVGEKADQQGEEAPTDAAKKAPARRPSVAPGMAGQPPAVPEEPQAVQIDKLQAGKQAGQPAPQSPAKSAAGRRGVQSRAAQYQAKLAEARGKTVAGDVTQAVELGVPLMPGMPAGGAPAATAAPTPVQADNHARLGDLAQGGQLGRGAFSMGGHALLGSGQAAGGAYLNAEPGGGAVPTGLASLDVAFPGFDPERWTRHGFTTPRGSVALSARALSVRAVDRLQRFGVAVLVVLAVLALRRTWSARALEPRHQRSLATVLILAGVVSLLAGVFPIAGLAALLAGGAWRLGLALCRRSVA